MASYGETYLQGLMHLGPMVANQRRLNEAEWWHRQNLERQYAQMQLLERQRMNADQQRMFGLQETLRHHGALEQQMSQNLTARLLGLENQLNQGNFERVEDSQGNQWSYDKRRNIMRPVGGGMAQGQPQGAGGTPGGQPMTFNAPRPVPEASRKQLESLVGDYQASLALAKSFKPSYVNSFGETAGELENKVRAFPLSPMDPNMANWWRDYRALQANPERHKLYGSNLTRPEITSYEQSSIHPGLRAGDLLKSYAVRLALQNRAVQRHMEGLSKRFNRREVESISGMPINAQPPIQGMPNREQLISEGMRLMHPLEDVLGN